MRHMVKNRPLAKIIYFRKKRHLAKKLSAGKKSSFGKKAVTRPETRHQAKLATLYKLQKVTILREKKKFFTFGEATQWRAYALVK